MLIPPRQAIEKSLNAGQALFYVICQEETRLETMLAELAGSRVMLVWSCAAGLTGAPELTEPMAMARHLLANPPDGLVLLKDMPAHFPGNPGLIRALRELEAVLSTRGGALFLSYPYLDLPETLKRQARVIDLGVPGEAELLALLKTEIGKLKLSAPVPESWFDQCASAMKGLGLDEAGRLLRRLIRENRLALASALPEIAEAKSAALLKEGCLKVIEQRVEVDRVGGLDNLKEWVHSRRALFSGKAREAGVPAPSGVLFMGVSGCGKSMAAKVIASAWNLPLARLDMNLVLSGAFGAPEFAFDRALRVAEQIAPLVLWIDEMENSFGYDRGASGGNNNIFSSFLTWMQEKPDGVFVVATANRIEMLPAEVIRKGRFDQLFFLDLPSDDERKAIFRIHIEAHGGDPARFNLNLMAAATRNWSGAEIEQAVKAARIHAWKEGRMFNDADVMWNTARMVPLSRTMEEQIKTLRQWSQTRATPASRKVEGG